jgi:hypothetical protein
MTPEGYFAAGVLFTLPKGAQLARGSGRDLKTYRAWLSKVKKIESRANSSLECRREGYMHFSTEA